MKKYLTTIVCPFMLVFNLYSQVPEIIWQQCYGSPDTDYNQCILKTDAGYLVGMSIYAYEPGVTNYHGGVDIWVLEIDTIGNILWERCYGGNGGDGPEKLIKTSDNNYYIIGGTNSTDGDVQSYNNGSSDYWIVKINSSGEIIWEKCFGTSVAEGPRDALLTPDGGLLVMGRIHASGGDVSVYDGDNYVWLFKVDSLGNLKWKKTLGNQYLDNGVTMIYNSEGNIMLIGAVAGYGGMVECYPYDDFGDVWLVELDMLGNILWQRCYGGSYYDLGYKIVELDDGYIFTVSSSSNDGDVSGHHGPAGNPPNGWNDIWAVRIDDQGEILWQKSLGGNDSDTPYYVTQTEDYGFIIMGITYSNDGDVSGNHSWTSTYTDIWTVKLDSLGNIEWQRCFGSWGREQIGIHSVIKKSDYNYVIAAKTNYASDDVQCTIHAPMDYDTWLFEIDLEDTTGIFETPTTQDKVKVYPNPARDYVVFELSTQRASHQVAGSHPVINRVSIFDFYGRRINNPVIYYMDNKIVWDCRGVQNGIYFYSLEMEGKVVSGKIIIQK